MNRNWRGKLENITTYKIIIVTLLHLSYHQSDAAAIAYRNASYLVLWYNSAAILIKIPKWSGYQQKLITVSMGENHGVAT